MTKIGLRLLPNSTESDILKLFPFRHVFLTGSRAFGWASSDSDWDVCILVGNRGEAEKIIKANLIDIIDRKGPSFKQSDYNSGFKGVTKYGEINVIPLHPLDFVCWWLATQQTKKLGMIPGVKERLASRELKLAAFEQQKSFYKSLISYEGEEKTMAKFDNILAIF